MPSPAVTEQDHVKKLVAAILADGYSISVDNGGDDFEILCSTSQQDIEAVLFATDDENLICHKHDYRGRIYLVYGNAPDEVINDYSETLDPIVQAVHKELFPE